MFRSLLVALAGMLTAATASAAPLAVLPVESAELSTAERAAIDRALREALAEHKIALLPEQEVRQQVAAAAELGLHCAGDDMPCNIKVGTLSGFERLLAVQATRVGQEVILSLGLATVNPPRTSAVTQQTVEVTAKSAKVRGPVTAIFAPEAFVGGVEVKGVPAGAQIYVDGELQGRAPLSAPIAGLKAGAVHKVKVEAAGFRPITAQVMVAFDEVAAVELAMAPDGTTSVAVDQPAADGAPAPAGGGTPTTSEAEATALSVPFHGVLWSGVAIGAVGLTAAVVGGAALGGAEFYLGSPGGDLDTRASVQNLGRVGAGALAVGALMVVIGAGTAGASVTLLD